jgi:hypothetical protein
VGESPVQFAVCCCRPLSQLLLPALHDDRIDCLGTFKCLVIFQCTRRRRELQSEWLGEACRAHSVAGL